MKWGEQTDVEFTWGALVRVLFVAALAAVVAYGVLRGLWCL